MSSMSAEQRGDLAEQMLPTAAHLAVLVHGDGGPEDVRDVLDGLDDTQKNALIVVLAGLVDPEQPVGKALGWLDFNEHGALTVPASWSEQSSVRDLAPENAEELDDDYVDPVAVIKFVRGFRVDVTDAEFLAAVKQCVAMEMTLSDINNLRGWPAKTAENWVNRIRKQYQRSGRVFPSLARPSVRMFSEQDVVTIRQRSAAGASDVELGMSFDASRETIRAIVTGNRYPQYGGPIRQTRSAQSLKASREHMCGHGDNSQAAFYGTKPTLTAKQRDAILERTRDGEDVKELAVEYQVPASTIRHYAA
jgi:DNA-binding NarL/FixJ family response regulator